MRARLSLIAGVLAAGCGRIDFDVVPLPEVDVFPGFSAAARWRDYVTLGFNTPVFLSEDALCDIAPPTEVADCVHAGIIRRVPLDLASCAGVTAIDSKGVLQWTCDESSGAAIVYSTGFVAGKGLADLVGPTGWSPMSVRIDVDGRGFAESKSAAWWSDPVRPLPASDSGQVTLAEPDTIYVAEGNMTSAGYLIDADGISVVVPRGKTLTASGTTPNCDDATGSGSARRCVIAATARENLWIEGDIDVAGDADVGVLLSGTTFSRMHLARVVSAQDANVLLYGASGNFLDDVYVAHAGNDGLALRAMSYANAVFDLRAFSNGILGNPNSAGVRLDESWESSFVQITTANNADHGVMTTGTNSYGNTFAFLTIVNNSLVGLELQGSGANSTVNGFIANQPVGVRYATNGDFVVEVVAANNGVGVCGAGAQTPSLFDTMVFGGNTADCMQDAACSTPVTCGTWGPAQLRVVMGVDAGDALGGKLTVDDTSNSSDASGAAATVGDWMTFSQPLRGWGADGGPYPDPGNRGPCAGNCRIWDMTVATTSALATRDQTGELETELVVGDRLCPSALSENRSFADWIGSELDPAASEIIGDGYGDDDGLCERYEHCTYSTRHGADQGPPAAITSPACVYDAATRPRWIHAAP